MIGKIKDIVQDIITVELTIDIDKQPNLINVHVIFEWDSKKVVGEITDMNKQEAKVMLLGEIIDNKFIPGIDKKPSFKSAVRIVTIEELALVLGTQEERQDTMYFGKSSIYDNYKINVPFNGFFNHHFSILGNTGSGKSFATARLIQNIFEKANPPKGANIFIFDTYGEYVNAFSDSKSPNIHFVNYTTDPTSRPEKILKIPIYLMKADDLAILLNADSINQISIIEKALKLVCIFKKSGDIALQYQNDILARAILDIMISGEKASTMRDQITAILTSFSTVDLNLDAKVFQIGYTRPLKQCLYVDNTGKMPDMELVIDFIKKFITPGLELPSPDGKTHYTLKDLEIAMDFALISEGVLSNEKIFEYGNVLSVRLHNIAGSDLKKYFDFNKFMERDEYIKLLLTDETGTDKCQLVNFNINYVTDQMAKAMTKILSKMIYESSAESKDRAATAYHIIIEEAHRYVQNDNDVKLLGYNIFDRIAKEGRKYGVLLGLISQRPTELSDTAISQCSNFIIFRTYHPRDLEYIKSMVPNVSTEIVRHLKTLQPGNCIVFGSAFKVPVALRLDKPNPEPLSNNADIMKSWF